MTDSVEKKLYNAAHSVEPSLEFSEKLWRRIKLTPQNLPVSHRRGAWLWLPVSAVLLLALVIAVVSPQKVMAAIRSWLVFIPGLGFVEEGSDTLYLAEPVSAEQNGMKLVIDQAAADANTMTVSFHFEGLPADNQFACFYSNNRLVLPDGKTWLPVGGGGSGNEWRIEFAPLPQGVTGAALLSGLSDDSTACPGPKEWNVAFSLSAGAAKPEMLAVIDDPQIAPDTVGTMDTTVEGSTVDAVTASAVRILVDRVVEVDKGFLLTGHVEWDNPNWKTLYMVTDTMIAVDANGNSVPLEYTGEEGKGDNEFAVIIASKTFASPLSLSITNRMAVANVENGPVFRFDAGSNPQTGQSWEINQDLEIAGWRLNIQTVTVVRDETNTGSPAEMGYSVTLASPTRLDGMIVCSSNGSRPSAWGTWGKLDEQVYHFDTFYADGLPAGQVTCGFDFMRYQIPGVWTFQWSPPAKQ